MSGFFYGIHSWRAPGAPYIKHVVVSNSKVHHNRGLDSYSWSYARRQGSGILLIGVQDALIINCASYNNGDQSIQNPVGIGIMDSQNALITGCNSYSNLAMTDGRGVGFELGLGTSDSVITGCMSSDNGEHGYKVYAEFNGEGRKMNGSCQNLIIQSSTSTDDGYYSSAKALAVYGQQVAASNVTFADINITLSSQSAAQLYFYSSESPSLDLVGNCSFIYTRRIALMVSMIISNFEYALPKNLGCDSNEENVLVSRGCF